MAKTAPLKKRGAGAIRVRSRAAKRASSPSIDTDKSLKDIQPPSTQKTVRPSLLAIHQGAGVSKKSKNGRKAILSARAKRRQEKGLDRAEAVMDKTEKKVLKSKGKSRSVKERAKAWHDVNKLMAIAEGSSEPLPPSNAESKAEKEDIELPDMPGVSNISANLTEKGHDDIDDEVL